MFVIITTCAPKDAQSLLKKLLEQRVVACGNIMPTIRSLYWWKGSIQNDEEAFLFMETSGERVQEALESIKELHPYDVPKILALEPSKVNQAYLEWLTQETQK